MQPTYGFTEYSQTGKLDFVIIFFTSISLMIGIILPMFQLHHIPHILKSKILVKRSTRARGLQINFCDTVELCLLYQPLHDHFFNTVFSVIRSGENRYARRSRRVENVGGFVGSGQIGDFIRRFYFFVIIASSFIILHQNRE